MIAFGMGNTLLMFVNKYYKYNGKQEIQDKGLHISGYKSAWLADLVTSFILEITANLWVVPVLTAPPLVLRYDILAKKIEIYISKHEFRVPFSSQPVLVIHLLFCSHSLISIYKCSRSIGLLQLPISMTTFMYKVAKLLFSVVKIKFRVPFL
jgi:hypothetical protein